MRGRAFDVKRVVRRYRPRRWSHPEPSTASRKYAYVPELFWRPIGTIWLLGHSANSTWIAFQVVAVPDPRHLPASDAVSGFPAVRLFVERAQAAQPQFALTARNALFQARRKHGGDHTAPPAHA